VKVGEKETEKKVYVRQDEKKTSTKLHGFHDLNTMGVFLLSVRNITEHLVYLMKCNRILHASKTRIWFSLPNKFW
jgi:hypothetical protein